MYDALQRFNHNLNLACILSKAGIDEPNEIEVIEPEVLKPSNVERYYQWLVKMGNIYLNNHEEVVKGFHKVANF